MIRLTGPGRGRRLTLVHPGLSDGGRIDRLIGMGHASMLLLLMFVRAADATGAARFDHLDRVEARAAFADSVGGGVILAVVDTGVDVNHPAFANVVRHPGWDFVDDDDDPADEDGHGTHVAALALGTPSGVAPGAELLPIRALTSAGGDLNLIARAIRYAVDRGARVINLSSGAALDYEPAGLTAAVDYAGSRDVLIVTAAGNGDPATGLGRDLDRSPIYPASLRRAHVLTVAASDAFEPLAVYSNFGRRTVDVVAPGGLLPDDPIWSANWKWQSEGWWAARAGTSAAAPLAAGVAALIRSRRPDLSAARVKSIISETGIYHEELESVSRTGRNLNARRALDSLAFPATYPDPGPGRAPECSISGCGPGDFASILK